MIYLLLSVMLVLPLVVLTYGNRTNITNTISNYGSWILDMVDTVRTQTLIGYYENISRTKSAIEKSTEAKSTGFISN